VKKVLLGLSIFGLVGLINLNSSASAEPWFFHKFGELRSYHGHFLNVCGKAGYGPCRAVQYVIPAGGDRFFGSASLTIHRTAKGNYVVEIFIRALPDRPQGPISLMIVGDLIPLAKDQWRSGLVDGVNVAETFHITDAGLNERIVALMKAKNKLRVIYEGGTGSINFSLIGLKSALQAQEALKQKLSSSRQ